MRIQNCEVQYGDKIEVEGNTFIVDFVFPGEYHYIFDGHKEGDRHDHASAEVGIYHGVELIERPNLPERKARTIDEYMQDFPGADGTEYMLRLAQPKESARMLPTNDNWCGNWPGNYVMLSIFKLRPHKDEPEKWRVLVSGNDDCLYDFDTDEKSARAMFEALSTCTNITKSMIQNLGFEHF